jgi:hypothetical protein
VVASVKGGDENPAEHLRNEAPRTAVIKENAFKAGSRKWLPAVKAFSDVAREPEGIVPELDD